MELGNLIEDKRKVLVDTLEKRGKDLLFKIPISKYIAILDKLPNTKSYRYLSKDIINFELSLSKETDKETYVLYHNYALVEIIKISLNKLLKVKYPEGIRDRFYSRYATVLKKIDQRVNTDFNYKSDKFLKELAICRMSLLPAGPMYIDIDSLSRGFIFRSGIRQFLHGLFVIAFRVRGFSPFYRMHFNLLDRDIIKEFNPDGWDKLFNIMAELLEKNKKIKGFAGNSWMFDPAIKKTTPELGYIYDKLISNGGIIFFQGTDQQTVNDATFMNPKRKELYIKGKYLPNRYLAVFPRDRFLKIKRSKLIT